MSAQIIPYVFDDDLIRVVMRGEEAWFVATDVCRVLNIANSRDAVARLDDDEKADVGITDTSSNGVTQGRTVAALSEAGVYRLVFTSRKSEAERFKRWLAHEVIPSIRKTGRYAVDSAAADERALVEMTRAMIDLVREVRLSFGDAPAARLLALLGAPREPVAPPRPARPKAADGRAALAHLLAARSVPYAGANASIAVLEDALSIAHEAPDMAKKLGFLGIRREGQSLLISEQSEFVAGVFAETSWAQWRETLLAIPGARPAGERVWKHRAPSIVIPLSEAGF